MARGQAVLADDILYGDFNRIRPDGRQADAIAALLADDPPYHVDLGMLTDYSGGEDWIVLSDILEAAPAAKGATRSGVIPGSKVFEELFYTLAHSSYDGRYHMSSEALRLSRRWWETEPPVPLMAAAWPAIEDLCDIEGEWRMFDMSAYGFAPASPKKKYAWIYTDFEQPHPTILGMAID